jgi:hypothetical protein
MAALGERLDGEAGAVDVDALPPLVFREFGQGCVVTEVAEWAWGEAYGCYRLEGYFGVRGQA